MKTGTKVIFIDDVDLRYEGIVIDKENYINNTNLSPSYVNNPNYVAVMWLSPLIVSGQKQLWDNSLNDLKPVGPKRNLPEWW